MSLLFLSPFSFIQFYIPRKALDEVSDELASIRISEFPFAPLSCHFDPVVQALAECILPSFEIAAQASALYVDSVLRAIAVHMATAHARIAPLKASSGALADWQKKRVEELFEANLAGDLALADIAAECGLSTSHLTRAFRITFGIPPHQYLTNRRVELAKDLMVGLRMSLSEVARTCGFVDQAHFTRVFRGSVGVSPGRWRKGRE